MNDSLSLRLWSTWVADGRKILFWWGLAAAHLLTIALLTVYVPALGDPQDAGMLLAGACASFVLCWLVLTHVRPSTRPQLAEQVRPTAVQWGLVTALGLTCWVGLQVLTASPELTSTTGPAAGTTSLWLVLTLVLLSPVVEEVLTRGVLFTGLQRHLGTWVALLISTGIFALGHRTPEQVLGTLGLGIFFTVLLLGTGRLVAPIGAHLLANTASVLAPGDWRTQALLTLGRPGATFLVVTGLVALVALLGWVLRDRDRMALE